MSAQRVLVNSLFLALYYLRLIALVGEQVSYVDAWQ